MLQRALSKDGNQGGKPAAKFHGPKAKADCSRRAAEVTYQPRFESGKAN
jgi:hypothetical protein